MIIPVSFPATDIKSPSMGGRIGQHLTLENPFRVTGLHPEDTSLHHQRTASWQLGLFLFVHIGGEKKSRVCQLNGLAFHDPSSRPLLL